MSNALKLPRVYVSIPAPFNEDIKLQHPIAIIVQIASQNFAICHALCSHDCCAGKLQARLGDKLPENDRGPRNVSKRKKIFPISFASHIFYTPLLDKTLYASGS